jgi:hypothetical protein
MTYNDGLEEVDFSLRQLLKQWGWWAVPILLYASFYIWESPFTHNPPYAFSFSVLRIGQIVGIISSLLLGIWGLTIFHKTSFLVRSGIGMFGIGLAATILNSITDAIPYLVEITAGCQIIWLIGIWIYGQKQDLKASRKIRRNLIRARISLFGKLYVWMEISTRGLASVLFFISMTGLGYCQLFQHRGGYCLYGFQTMAWSLILFWFTFGLLWIRPNLQKLEIRILGNPFRFQNETHSIVLLEMKDHVLFFVYSLFVSIVSVGFGLFSRSDPRDVVFYWIAVVVLAAPFYGIVYWLILYRIERRTARDPGFDSALGPLRRVYQDHPELRRYIFGIQIPFKATETADGIQVEDLTGPRIYPWESVRHLWMRERCVWFVQESNPMIDGPLKLTGKPSKVRRESIFRLWGDKTYSKDTTEFIHPDRYRVRDALYNRMEPWGCIGLGIVFCGWWIFVFHLADIKTFTDSLLAYGMCGIFVLAGMALSGYGIYRLIYKVRVLDSILIRDEIVQVRFKDGIYVEFGARDILKIKFSKDPNGYNLYVKGIPVIRNIDKVSYFGVLKRRLDAMMAQQEQLKSVEEST